MPVATQKAPFEVKGFLLLVGLSVAFGLSLSYFKQWVLLTQPKYTLPICVAVAREPKSVEQKQGMRRCIFWNSNLQSSENSVISIWKAKEQQQERGSKGAKAGKKPLNKKCIFRRRQETQFPSPPPLPKLWFLISQRLSHKIWGEN